MKIEIYVDYNDNEDGLLDALLDHASGEVHPGDRVLTLDHEGNRCEGDVERVENGLAYIRPDWDTWRPAQVTPAGMTIPLPAKHAVIGTFRRAARSSAGTTTILNNHSFKDNAGLRPSPRSRLVVKP